MDAIIIGLLAGLLAFVGSALGHWIARKRDVELDALYSSPLLRDKDVALVESVLTSVALSGEKS